MKVMTILGTRPEIIRLSCVIPKLDRHCEHILVHTGQNYEKNLNDIFFRDLNIRLPDYYLGISGTSFGDQVGKIISRTEEIMVKERPNRLLVLGDTNSGLAAIPAKRLGITVFHMEAGNRCFDDRVPEEVNRRIIDHSSDILMPYSERSRHNLLHEGIPNFRIFVTGNPIFEVIHTYNSEIEKSDILEKLGIKKRNYFLVTLHRAENVDNKDCLLNIMQGLKEIYEIYKMPIVFSLHPRTKDKMEKIGLNFEMEGFLFSLPFGFFDFVKLEKNAACVMSDSGTVQEECCIFRVPNITIRNVTERPETIECGSNFISGTLSKRISECVKDVLDNNYWNPPSEYIKLNVSDTVIKIVLSYYKDYNEDWY